MQIDQVMNIWIKYLLTAGVVVAVSELAKKSDKLGAFMVAMPLVTILAMVWIFFDTSDTDKVKKLSDHAFYTFWYVVPTLPMFLVMPLLFKKGLHFSLVMLAYGAGTYLIFYLWAKLLQRFGIHLFP